MQLVGADPVLGRLQLLLLALRDQFGGNLGAEYRLQNVVGGRVELVGLHGPADQVLDQRLRDAGIDGVVAHLVAHAIGAPAEREFRQVARADDEAAVLVGEPEQVIGPETRLHVLEGDVVDRLAAGEGVAHILQHLACGGTDVDLGRLDPESAHQLPGIALRRLASGEAGHRVAEDGRARQAELVADLGRDDERMRRVEPARDADHHVVAARRLEAAAQPLDLDVERLVAV